MPVLTSRDDDDIEHAEHAQRREHPATEHHARGASAAATTTGASTAGASAGLAPSAAAAKSAIAPRVNILSPVQHGMYAAGLVPTTFEVFGAPNTTVVLYVTVYRRSKVYQNGHVNVALGPSGEATFTSYTPVDDNEHYGLHARVQTQAGVFSALRVVEYRGMEVISTTGGGV